MQRSFWGGAPVQAGRYARAGVAAALVLVIVGVLAAAAAGGPVPPSGTVSLAAPVAEWQADTPIGLNVSTFLGTQVCEQDAGALPVANACDVFELAVDLPADYWTTHKGGVRVEVTWTSADNDFDLVVFPKPNPGEALGAPVASSAQGGTAEEHVLLPRARGSYLVRVNAFLVVGDGYRGRAAVSERPGIPAVSGGLAQTRASSGPYLSYSEPHISMDPLDGNHLVAASKMYDNLERYRFKIGTFVTFDGGRSWTDNGQLPGHPMQRGDDAGYELTSDPWTAFDDEGNAYVMVLDTDDESDSVTGAGWGMSLHKSSDGGRTWFGPIAIHRNRGIQNLLLLDDKNALAVDNYGPDRDGTAGRMYGCWSLDAPLANVAIQVARSADAGMTWQDAGPISGLERTVIGCQIVITPPAAPGEPGAVHVFWLNFSDPSIRMATSTNGGITFSGPTTVQRISPIPRVFPNSGFRNLSLPTGGVDPRTGALYVAWADEHATVPGAPCFDADTPGQVCDADILLTRSLDGGTSWSDPVRVNQDPIGGGRDQFQPALAVTPSGQLNMMWFDRRNDAGNFYIDTFFARSNDGGTSWRETRVSRSMWDPSINPPISSSGEFIGDYQGIVADDSVAIPFWQDTSLANLAPSDPRYSPYQQVFSARIPNTAEFGGAGAAAARAAVQVPNPPGALPAEAPRDPKSIVREGSKALNQAGIVTKKLPFRTKGGGGEALADLPPWGRRAPPMAALAAAGVLLVATAAAVGLRLRSLLNGG